MESKEELNKVRMTVSIGEPKIQKVEMVDEGRKGLKITYTNTESRNGVVSGVKDKKEHYRPVQKEIRMYFREVREHLLRLTGYHWSNDTVKDMYLANTKVTYVSIDRNKGTLGLGGKMSVMDKYESPLTTDAIEAEDYDAKADLEEIIIKIFEEAKLFTMGLKGAEPRQVAIDYMIGNKGMNNAENEFDNMSLDEQKKFMQDAFEEYGMELIEMDEEEHEQLVHETPKGANIVVGGIDPYDTNDSDPKGKTTVPKNQSQTKQSATQKNGTQKQQDDFEDEIIDTNPWNDSDVDFEATAGEDLFE